MKVGMLLLVMGLASFGAYWMIGAHVDEQGVLIEPFPLIPLGYLGLAVGVLLLVIPRMSRVLRRRR
jgi:hypothetical protein